MKRLIIIGILSAFLAFPVIAADDHPDVDDTYFSRWSINNGKYFVEVGRYLEAIESFQTAIETTDKPHLKVEARLQIASVLSVFLDKFDEAVREYESIFNEFPQDALAETALYRIGFLYFSQSRFKEALPYIEAYLKKYPSGKFRGTAQFLLNQTRQSLNIPVPPQPSEFELPPLVVRVKLLKGADSISLVSQGIISVYSITGGDQVYQAGRQTRLQIRDGVIYADEKPLPVKEIRIKSNAPVGFMKAGKNPVYRGEMRVAIKEGRLDLVNYVNIEEYLYSVVPSESPSTWPIEALKAQAVAARTYVLFQMSHSKERDYDVLDDERSQAYGGMRNERANSSKAVDATRGQVLTYGGKPIYAMFTASSGWHTADPNDIFDQQFAYLQGFPDDYSKSEQHGQWTITKDAVEIESGLKSIGINISGITDIKPEIVDRSGRVIKVRIYYAGGNKVFRTRTTLKRAINALEILLTIEKNGSTYVFRGGGYGHGVGLSQWGAKDLAEKGTRAEDILSFYYRNATIVRMW